MLDNEAVQALATTTHSKHRRVLAHLEGVVSRRRRGRAVVAVVPSAVRVEAGWDRTAAAALLNRLQIRDHVLDGPAANVAARIVSSGVASSVADAHVGATVRDIGGDVVVLTSDPDDMAAVSGPAPVRIVTI